MRKWVLPGITLLLLLPLTVRGSAAGLTAGDLSLRLDDAARVTGIAVGKTELPVTPGPLVSLCDVANGEFVPGSVAGGDPERGWQIDFGAARAHATLAVATRGGALRFTCGLKGEDLPARGMLLRFSFPLDAIGWRWYGDMQGATPIAAGRTYENVVPLRAYADLPEWRDKPALRMGYSNRNFCTVLAGPAGLCLAVPLDRPCIFRTAYNGAEKRLEIVYDFALSPDTRRPNEVSFAFDLYACGPAWGMRSALERYYRMYPELFKVHARDQGQWMAFARLSEIDNANEFGFGLQEGAPEPEYDDKIGVLSTTYFTHAGMFANIPNHDPEKQPLPPYETQVAAMEGQFRRTTGMDGLYEKVGLHTPAGKLDVQRATVYGHLIAQFTLDPELSYGEWTLKRTATVTESAKKNKGGDLDGFYYDGLSAGIDYNPAHFRTADAPPLWDPAARKPYLNNFFASCEFARAAAEMLRPKGQVTMMNGALGDSFYVVPWLDVLGAETGLRIPRESFNYIRSVIHHKPFLTLLKGNYEKSLGRPEIELFMKRCLAYGAYPGFFDWPPSGLGPGGQYHSHPRYYERDRDLHRKYLPLCRALALAGWEPVTHARSSEPAVFVERFGPTPEGVAWWTLLNEDSRPHQTTLTLDLAALGLDGKAVRALDLVSGAAVALTPKGGMATARLSVPADGVLAIQVAKPQAAARWRAAQALETLDRGTLMRRADAEKPAIPVHWRPTGAVARETVDGAQHVVLVADGKRDSSCRQWAMLFQPSAGEAVLRVRAAAEGMVGAKSARVRCVMAWVTPSFSHYETVVFELPEGTWDWRDFEFAIRCPQALRAVEIHPTLSAAAKGRLKLASMSLTDSLGEHVIDGQFREWYEPVPTAMRERLDKEVAGLRASLASLEKTAPQLAGGGARQALSGAFARCGALRRTIAAEKAENGCRRMLRDLETVEGHLGPVALSAYGVPPPSITGPAAAAPGETVSLSFTTPKAPGVPARVAIRAAEAKVAPRPGGAAVTLPRTAAVGSSIDVIGALHLGKPGAEAIITASHRIAVVAPLELALKSGGVDPVTGAARLQVSIRNNRVRPASGQLAVHVPAGWHAAGSGAVSLPASGGKLVEVKLAPAGAAAAGPVEVSVTATAGADSCQARTVLLYIPKEANLLKNPGFEDGRASWSGTKGTLDEAAARSGKTSLRLGNPTPMDSEASQSVTLNQKTPCPILVQASSRAGDVSGTPGKGYSLYVDIYYTDGTPLYGRTFDFRTGTTGWQLGELYIEPEKPIKVVNLYLLLRGRSGTAWFDDVAVMEDPRRKGNIARDATPTVDSSYSGYEASPVNDGVIMGEGLHWTKEAWASAEEARDHFILLSFPEPRTVERASIYWSLDAGVPRTSREVQLQVPDGEGWKTVATVKSTAPVPQTEVRLPQAATSDRFRLLQPKGAGPEGRGNLMWVREVELFAAP